MNELQGSEAGAAKSILSAPDTATAAQAIVNNFLRPAPEHRQARSSRYASAPNTAIEAIQAIAPIEQGDENPMAGMPVMPQGTEYVDPLVAPFTGRGNRVSDFTQFPEISTAPSIPFDQGNFDERFGGLAPVAPPAPAPMPMAPETQQQPQINPRLAA